MTGRKGPPRQTTFVFKRGTTNVPNGTVHDKRLSYGALGLLVVILAHPESMAQGYRAWMGRGMGQVGILGAFQELVDAGYRHQITKHAPNGRVTTYTVVAEEPIPKLVARQWLEEQIALLDDDPDHAWHSDARRHLRKRASDDGSGHKAAGRTVRDLPVPGEPVPGEPVPGEPVPGEPVPGEPPHKPSVSKGSSSLRSQNPEKDVPSDSSNTPVERSIPADFRERRTGS